jgi:hypothetical protein
MENGNKVMLFGLGKAHPMHIYNGRLCTVQSSTAVSSVAVVQQDTGGAAGDTEQQEEGQEMEAVAAQGAGPQDERGVSVCFVEDDSIMLVPPESCFPNTTAGRQRLLAERGADVLALRGAFQDQALLGGLSTEIAPKIAQWLTPPERLMVFSGFRGKIFNTVYMHSAVSGGWYA